MVDRILRMGIGVVVGVWVARYLGPMRFGSLNFALAFVSLLGTAATLGTDNLIVREIVVGDTDVHATLGTTLALRLAGATAGVLIALAAVRFIQPGDRTTSVLVGITSIGLFFQAFDTIDSYFQSQVRSKLTVWAKNTAFLALAGVLRFWCGLYVSRRLCGALRPP